MTYSEPLTLDEAYKIITEGRWEHADIQSVVIPALCIVVADMLKIQGEQNGPRPEL